MTWLCDGLVARYEYSSRAAPKPERRVIAFSIAEIRFGIELVADPGRRADLNEWLTHKVLMVEEGRKAGHTFSQPDLIIAATALHRGLAVVSRGIADYQRACIPLHNP